MQVKAYLRGGDRCIVPIGSTEQRAQPSLCVDAILAERASVEAAEPLGIPVFPMILLDWLLASWPSRGSCHCVWKRSSPSCAT